MKTHVAIMKKSWGLLPKILTGEKTIESRWYLNKSRPWGNISAGETVYFKNSGEAVTVKAKVHKVLEFKNLTPKKVKEILEKYKIGDFYENFKNKKYCILVFLKNPKKVKPFNINKSGFGAMSAWITIDNIDTIRA